MNTPDATDSPRPPLRVLVADADPDSAGGLARLLKAWGFAAEAARDGPTTLALALAWRPDVCLLELALPGLDGCAFARRLREKPGPQDVLLVALTGYAASAFRWRALDAGFHVCL